MEKYANLPETEKRELVDAAYRLGYEYEQKYGNCPQCVIAAIQDVFDCIDNEVFKSGHALAGGFGLTSKGTCGALSGAGMIIGALQGRDKENFTCGRNPKSYKLAKKVLQRFVEEYGGCLCCEVQQKLFGGKSYDLSIKEEYQEFEKAGGHDDKCPGVVGNTAKWVAEMIVRNEI